MRTSKQENWLVFSAASLLMALVFAVLVVPQRPSASHSSLAQQSRELLGAFMRGDPTALQVLADLDPVDTVAALTPDAAKVAMGADASFTLEDDQSEDTPTRTTFTATMHTPTGNVPLSIRWIRTGAGDQWRVQPIDLPRLEQNASGRSEPASYLVNGQSVVTLPSPQRSFSFPVWPGLATVKTILKADSGLPPLPEQRITLTAALGRDDASTTGIDAPLVEAGFDVGMYKEVTSGLNAYLSTCAAVSPSSDPECPFSPFGSYDTGSQSPQMRKVSFSSPRLDGPDYERDGSITLGGTVKVTAERLIDGAWKQQTLTRPFEAAGQLSYSAGPGVEFRLNSREVVKIQRDWALSRSER